MNRKLMTALCGLIAITLLTSCNDNSSSQSTTSLATTTTEPVLDNPKINGWLPYWDDGSGLQAFEQHAALFRSIHPFWYEATSATKIAFQGKASQKDRVIKAARAANAKVIPTITGNMKPAAFKQLLSDEAQRSTHVATICNLIIDNQYDGVDINYEHFAVSPEEADIPVLRDLYSTFITELNNCLDSANKTTEVTVMARTNDSLHAAYRSKLAIGVYDYAALGKAADIIRPMAYDYSYASGPAGSLDPITWVEEIIKYSTSHIDPKKIELGLPTYGQDWSGNGADVVLAKNGAALASKHNAVVQLDEATQSLTFEYNEDSKAHKVWFDDTSATLKRVQLAKQYRLNGISLWALGYESPELWTSLP